VVEASLGAAYLSGGLALGFKAAKALLIPFDEFKDWDDLNNVYKTEETTRKSATERSKANITPAYRKAMSEAEKVLGYTFNDPTLFYEAMTHSSHSLADHFYYERLEFLGDAILDFHVVQYYYEKYPTAPPGVITAIKSASVNNGILGALCFQLGLDKCLNYQDETLADLTKKAYREIEEKKRRSPANTLTGEYWNGVNMPKILGDIVESTIGAVFVDSGFNFEVASDLFTRLIKPFLDQHINFEGMIIHPVIRLLEKLQAEGCSAFKLENLSPNEPQRFQRLGLQQDDVEQPTLKYGFMIHDQVIKEGTGFLSEEIRKEVSIETIKFLDENPGFLSTICTCPKSQKPRHLSTLDKYMKEN
jgi:dsRNA-specific ribonuclease